MPQYELGFKDLAIKLGPDVVGDPLTDVVYGEGGEGVYALQYTTKGQMMWIKDINKTYFFPAAQPILAAPAPEPEIPTSLEWPIFEPIIVTQKFGINPNVPPYGSNGHQGIDLIPGDYSSFDVFAAHGGYAEAGENEAWGKHVVVFYQGHSYFRTIYAHLAQMEPSRHVAPGDWLGTMGSTGWARGVHLHFAVLVGGGSFIDPETMLEAGHDVTYW